MSLLEFPTPVVQEGWLDAPVPMSLGSSPRLRLHSVPKVTQCEIGWPGSNE